MTDYQKMYYILCDAGSRALDALEAGDVESAHELIQDALNRAEDIYVATSDAWRD